MKFLDLFGKPSPQHLKHVRPLDTHAVQDTARKIDAIESEITAEREAIAQASSESPAAPHIEQQIAEAGILYASRQARAAEMLLLEAVSPLKTDAETTASESVAWMMLLELADFAHDKQRFDELSLRYAQRFETSPPQWRQRSVNAPPAAITSLAFRGKLLASSGPALEHLEQRAQQPAGFSIDLQGITDIDGAGCDALLALFRRWSAQCKQVTLLPAPALLSLLRDLAHTKEDASGAAWELLLELLRVTGDEAAYEAACVDYSVAFERSPPASMGFVAAKTQGSTGLCLPEEITAPVDALIRSLGSAADASETIVMDCRRLRLVEFNAAAALLDGIARLAKGKPVEWRDLPYLVSTLLTLVGGEGKLIIRNRQP